MIRLKIILKSPFRKNLSSIAVRSPRGSAKKIDPNVRRTEAIRIGIRLNCPSRGNQDF